MRSLFLILGVFSLITGCAGPKFSLSDESAMRKLMATQYVHQLQQRIPVPLICFVESSDFPNARDLYLGESHPGHAVRLCACRATGDGRVWVNADETLLEDQWIEIK